MDKNTYSKRSQNNSVNLFTRFFVNFRASHIHLLIGVFFPLRSQNSPFDMFQKVQSCVHTHAHPECYQFTANQCASIHSCAYSSSPILYGLATNCFNIIQLHVKLNISYCCGALYGTWRTTHTLAADTETTRTRIRTRRCRQRQIDPVPTNRVIIIACVSTHCLRHGACMHAPPAAECL